jgi:hypothetical protein
MAPSVDVISPMGVSQITFNNDFDSPYPTISDPNEGAAPKLPGNWPLLHSPLSWAGSDFRNESEYVYELSQYEILEITSALRHFQGNDEIPTK